MARFRFTAWLFCFAAAAGLVDRSYADSDAQGQPHIERISIGFDGFYKTGYWNPVRITVTGGERDFSGKLSITVLDGDGIPVRHLWGKRDPLVIPAKATTTLEHFIKFGRRNKRILIAFHSHKDPAAAAVTATVDPPVPLDSDRELILSWGPPIGLDAAVGRRLRAGAGSPKVCELSDASQFPESWAGYDAVNTVVMSTSNAEALDKINARQFAALHEWVKFGGKLVLCIGSRGGELLGPGGRFAELVPGPFQEITSLRLATPLETYSGMTFEKFPGGVPMTLLRDVRGKVELFDLAPSGQRPMVIRSPLGFGQVVFVAFDLDQPPFVQWAGRSHFVQRVLRESPERSDSGESSSPGSKVSQFGYKDMSGQLRSALDQFGGVTLVAFSWVAGLLLLYVVLIGPADYFLLRDVLRRMQWTWISFPLFASGFVLLAVIMNARLKEDRVQVNHLDLVDLDEASATLRGTTWTHIYSPRPGLFDVALRPRVTNLAANSSLGNLFAWHGLPGTALGGLDIATAAEPTSSGAYQLEFEKPDSTQLAGVPLPVASTKSFGARWWGQAQMKHRAALTVDADGLLRGEVVNPLPVTLTDCTVLFGNWVYRLDSRQGVLETGERTRVEMERALNLQWRLCGRRVIDSKDVSTPWDQNTLDVNRILEMMMLHGAAGGETYTQLANHYQAYIDLSNHLQMGRAILVGRASSPTTELSLNGTPVKSSDEQHWTYYRVVFPVQPYRPENNQ